LGELCGTPVECRETMKRVSRARGVDCCHPPLGPEPSRVRASVPLDAVGSGTARAVREDEGDVHDEENLANGF
jgi:hypothetical protein